MALNDLRLGFLSLLSQRQKKDLTIVGTDSFFSPVELFFLQRCGRCELHHPGRAIGEAAGPSGAAAEARGGSANADPNAKANANVSLSAGADAEEAPSSSVGVGLCIYRPICMKPQVLQS